jgi:HEAT repeat protein
LRALQQAPSPRFADALRSLATCGEPEVMREAAAAIAGLRSPSFLDVLVPMLRDRRLRETARRAILAGGPAALARIDALLASPATTPPLLRHLPRTISRFPAAEAAPVLMRHLLGHRDGLVRYKCLRGLGRLRENHPRLQLDRASIVGAADRAVATATKVRAWRSRLARLGPPASVTVAPVDELLGALLEDKEAHAVERAFRLLKLARPAERWDYVHAGLRSPDPRVRGASRELLEELLPRPLRGLLDLADGVSPDDGVTTAATGDGGPSEAPRRALLAEILRSGGETERALAAHYAALAGFDTQAAVSVSRPGDPAPSARALAILADAPPSVRRVEPATGTAGGGAR